MLTGDIEAISNKITQQILDAWGRAGSGNQNRENVYCNSTGVILLRCMPVEERHHGQETVHPCPQVRTRRRCAERPGRVRHYAEADRWYRKAAVQGYASAQYYLGLNYGSGRGVTQDYAEAYMWYNLAASRTTGETQDLYAQVRDIVAKKMTARQIAEAQRRAREWRTEPPK